MGNLLNGIFNAQSIKLNLEGKTKDEVFVELVDAIRAVHPEYDRALMLASLWERENKLSTGIASGIAIPHAFCRGINTIAGAIGISKEGIEYDALDHQPVYVVFMLAIGGADRENHLRTLSQIAALVQSEALSTIKLAQNTQTVETVLSRPCWAAQG